MSLTSTESLWKMMMFRLVYLSGVFSFMIETFNPEMSKWTEETATCCQLAIKWRSVAADPCCCVSCLALYEEESFRVQHCDMWQDLQSLSQHTKHRWHQIIVYISIYKWNSIYVYWNLLKDDQLLICHAFFLTKKTSITVSTCTSTKMWFLIWIKNCPRY